MNAQLMVEKEVLFEEQVRLTKIREYGFSWEQLISGDTPIPLHGAQFEIYFEGNVTSSKINGRVEGVDHLSVRPDGKFSLTLYATIVTDDGANIKIIETGINDSGELRLNMNFHTTDKRYEWLNQVLAWGVGTVNFETSTAEIKAYKI